jgi:MFS family permease
MNRLLHLDLGQKSERNAWYLVLEMFWAAILASAAAFNAAFALRLGATNTQIGLLTSLPALLAVIVSIPAGRFLQRKRRHKPWILTALTLARSGYLLVALLPWLHLAGIPLGEQVILTLIVFTIPVHFFNVGFIPMLAEVTSEERRAAIFSARNIAYNASVTVLVFLFGQWLSRVSFPINYQAMFIFGFATSLLSLFYLIKVDVPDFPVIQPQERPRLSLREQVRRLRESAASYPGFFRITTNTFMHGMGVWMAAPLYILYYVRNLGASDAWIGLQAMIASSGIILGYIMWRWILARWKESKTLKRTIVCLGLFPVLVGLSPSLTPILFAVALNNLIVPGVNLSHFNTLLKVTPPDKRPEYTALYMAFVNIGIFIFPMLGVALADWLGLRPVLIGCGIFSILGSTSFWFRPVISE